MKVCLKCGNEFEPKRDRAKFCSDICRAGFHQALKTAKPKLKFAGPSGRKAADLFKQLMAEVKTINYAELTEPAFYGKKLPAHFLSDECGQISAAPKKTVADKIKDLEDEILRVGPSATTLVAFNQKKIKELKKKL